MRHPWSIAQTFFEQWVAYPQPEGLGVDSQHGAEYFRDLLLGAGRIGMWASIMEYISVKPGRRENLVDDDSFRPYYHVSTASNAIDRMLRSLKLKRPELYALVLDGQLTLREAAKEAGLIKDSSGWAAAVAKLLTGLRGWMVMDRSSCLIFFGAVWSRLTVVSSSQHIVSQSEGISMSLAIDEREKIRERVAAEHDIQLYMQYSEKRAAKTIGWDYSTLKRKRRAGMVPFVPLGGGSVGYMGCHIVDIILFGVKAKEQWADTQGASSSAETGGSAPSLEGPDTSAAGSRAGRSSALALALAILTKRKSV